MMSTVRIYATDTEFEVATGESLLQAAQRAGVDLPHECTFGGCGTCRVRVREGQVRYDEFPMALTEAEHAEGYALACQARCAAEVVEIQPLNLGEVLPPPCVTRATVVAVHALTHDIVRLVLHLPEYPDLAYLPGQYMNIRLPDGATRSFSMASARLDSGCADFHIRRIEGGYFTGQLLAGLNPGDVLDVEIPLGSFCLSSQEWRPLVLAGTGTGLAPLKAMLESLLDDDDCPPVSLYWGMRTESDLYLARHIEAWKSRLYEFRFVPVLSRADASWTGRRGYVQDAILADLEDPSEPAFYLCGSPAMIGQTTAALLARGVDLASIRSDSFTFQHPAAQAA